MVAEDVEFLVQDLGDLKEAYQKIGDKVLLGANIPITNVILKGSTEEVERCCIQAILKTEGNFFQSASCHIPWHTPPENFETWVKAAKDYASYPIDFDYLRARLEKLPPLGCDEELRGVRLTVEAPACRCWEEVNHPDEDIRDQNRSLHKSRETADSSLGFVRSQESRVWLLFVCEARVSTTAR